MLRRYSALIAFTCALFLLSAQGLAFAHAMQHLGAGAQSSWQAASAGKDVHDGEDADEHRCLLCLALAGVDASPPSAMALARDALAASGMPAACRNVGVPGRFLSPYGARAPPVFL